MEDDSTIVISWPLGNLFFFLFSFFWAAKSLTCLQSWHAFFYGYHVWLSEVYVGEFMAALEVS